MNRVLPTLALLATGCIGEPPENTPTEVDWDGAVRVHLVLPTLLGGPQGEDVLLQPIDRAELRSLVDVPIFVHHGTPDELEASLDECAVDSEARDPQLPAGVRGAFSDVLLMGPCGPGLGDLLLTENLDLLFATRLTEVVFAGEPGQFGLFPEEFERRLGTWRASPPRVGDCYPDTILPDLCLGCEIHETSQGFTGPYGEEIVGAKADRCTGAPGSTGGFGAYNLFDEGGTALLGNLFYRAADHVVGDGLRPPPPTLSQAGADNWRWERGQEWPATFRMVPNPDGYLLRLSGDPPGTSPVGWQAARHDTFGAEVEWPIAERVYVTRRDDGTPEGRPVGAILVDLDDTDPSIIADIHWYARRGEASGGLLPAEERLYDNEPNFFLTDGDPEWEMAHTPILPPVRP